MPLPPDPDPFDRDVSDPLLLFVEEPKAVAESTPTAPNPPQTSPETDRPVASPALDAMRSRAEAAEKSLLEARRTVAALKREMATLVTSATNKPAARPHWRTGVTAVTLALMLLAAVAGWYFTPVMPLANAAPALATVEPMPVPQPPTPTPSAQPAAAVVPQSPRLPPRADRVRAAAPEPVSRQYFGTLSVDAVPGGGEVFINRKSVGKTPALITGLRAGSHLVWIERPGYRLWTRVVLVPADKVSRVSVALEPDPATAVRP